MTIKLTFNSVFELHQVLTLFNQCQNNLVNEIDFVMFYNCESFKNKVLQKQFTYIGKKNKKINVSVNVNEFDTFRSILISNRIETSVDNIILVTFANELINQGNKQIENFENLYKSR